MTEKMRLLLKPLALLYRGIVLIRNFGFDRKLLRSWPSPLPVVSIGNVSVGGTGKTPLADWIVRYYLSIGEKPALISRGYGRSTKGVQLVSDGKHIACSSREAGDETFMLAARNPGIIVVAAEKRRKGVEFILHRFPDSLPSVIVLDDAFQHRQIDRNIDIVVINAGEWRSGEKLLPEGRLRESERNVARADLIVLSKITERKKAEETALDLKRFGVPVVLTRTATGDLLPFTESGGSGEKPADRGVLAFAGIGSPEGFLKSLREKGVTIEAHRFFRDHEPYSPAKLRSLVQEAEEKGLALVTTEKDYFRLLGTPDLFGMLAERNCRYLRVHTVFIEGREIIETMLRSVTRKERR